MDLTILPTKKTVARWEHGLLVIAQGNAVIELTPDQAEVVLKFIEDNLAPSIVNEGASQDLGN